MNMNGYDPQDLQVVANRLIGNSLVLERAANLGVHFSGERDIYKAAGYPDGIGYNEYLKRFRRQDIAKRIVKAAPDSTWRRPPTLLDGKGDDAQDDTAFTEAWKSVVEIEDAFTELVDSKNVWHYLRRADVLAGLGEYAVIVVGVRDGLELFEPLERGSLINAGVDGFLYLAPYGQGNVSVSSKVSDRQNPRFGLPERYTIDDIGGVHWSRVIHIAEELLTDEVEGLPRMEAPYNRLLDLEKVLPAAAEAAWKLLYKGMVITTQPGYSGIGGGIDTDEVKEYIHGLTRVLELEGVDVTFEGGESVDPSALVDVLITFVSISIGIPKRILTGSEMGQLASSQDESNWAARIAERQEVYAEPIILRPLINRLIYTGIMPPPVSGTYSFRWPSLFEQDETEMSAIAKTQAETVALLDTIATFDRDELRERILSWPAQGVSASRSFLVNRGGEGVSPAEVADKSANRASSEIRGLYSAWIADVQDQVENVDDSDKADIIAALLLILRGRVTALTERHIRELGVLLKLDTVELLAMRRVTAESLDVFDSRTLENIRANIEAGEWEAAQGRGRDAALLGGIMWTAYQAAKFAKSPTKMRVRWAGPNNSTTCKPCRVQMAAGCRPLDETPLPGPGVCDGLTQCRHEIEAC